MAGGVFIVCFVIYEMSVIKYKMTFFYMFFYNIRAMCEISSVGGTKLLIGLFKKYRPSALLKKIKINISLNNNEMVIFYLCIHVTAIFKC